MEQFSQFEKKVDISSRESMIDFLKSHFRYYLMSSWNQSMSYANNIKIYNLGTNEAVKNQLYEMLDTNATDMAKEILTDFRDRYDGLYQICHNGRSDGYLVLYRGFKKQLEYKSYCPHCGQFNFQTATGNNCLCGKCGMQGRVNFEKPLYRYGVTSKDIDDDADFEQWSDNYLKERVLLVQDFDRTCDNYIARIIETAEKYTVEEETVYVPQTRRVLREKQKG